jgi:hypothetical protein
LRIGAGILKRAARAAIAAALAAAAAALALTIAGRVRGPIAIDMIAAMPRSVASGFYPPERAGDLSFAWTSGRADLTLADLTRDRVWTCEARVRAARRAPPMPRLEVLVDGLSVLSRDAPNDFEDVRFDLPTRASRADTRLTFAVSPTIVPGPQDRRPLGVQVDRISCAPPNGGVIPLPGTARAAAIGVAAAFAAAAALAGVPLGGAFAIADAIAAAQVIPLSSGIAGYTPFVRTMSMLGVWIALVTLLLVTVIGLVRRRAIAPFPAAFTAAAAGALYLQLLGLLHPAKAPIDVVFQAHRFETVLAGNYFFTQPMPGGVSFPYAIGLYLFAAPWARLTSNHEALLRIVVCASDAAGFLLLFWLALRAWRDRAAAASVLMLAFALPLAFEVIGNANLTNEFGHAVSTAALAIAAALPGSRRRLPHAVLLAAVCTLALVAHVSTFALLVFTLSAMAALFWWIAEPGFRRAAAALLAVTIVSSTVAFAGYYAHFMDVYKVALRVRTGSAVSTSAPSPSGEIRGRTASSLPGRIVDSVEYTRAWLGWPLTLLGAAGAWRLVRERRRDPATVTVLACAAAYAVFVGVSVMRVQPAYQRYTVEFVSRVVLASSPGVLLLAGAGASWGLRRGPIERIATCLLIAAAFAIAGRDWMAWFA